MMEKNNFILRLKARQALAGHWQTALVVMLVASLPSWLAQIASLVQGGGLQQQLLTVLQYGNPELRQIPSTCCAWWRASWVPRGCCPTCSACCPFW